MALLLYIFEPECNDVEDTPSLENSTELDSDTIAENIKSLENSNWCTCIQCVIMPTAVKCLCCHEEDVLSWRLCGPQCVVEHATIYLVCLNYRHSAHCHVFMVDVTEDAIKEPLNHRFLNTSAYDIVSLFIVFHVMGFEVDSI